MTANAVSGYSDRVSNYARHRWDYAPEAVEGWLATADGHAASAKRLGPCVVELTATTTAKQAERLLRAHGFQPRTETAPKRAP